MHKIAQDIKKELKQIEETGLSAGNLDAVGKMVDIYKDITEINEMEAKQMQDYRYGRMDYNRGGYNGEYNEGRDGYGARMRDSRGGYMEGNYNEGNYGRGGNFINMDPRMWDRLERIMDGADMYQYGRDRYRGGDSEVRMVKGLEELMYAVCTFVESMMDFAETPQEKEIIRKHLQKMSKM